jgi:hypothetical protein
MTGSNQFEQDLIDARVYLTGYSEPDGAGIPRLKFIKKRSAYEKDCRRALARVLRSGRPLPSDFIDCLADMFEPEENRYRPYSSRELVAKNRSTHRREDNFAVSHITRFVWERSGRGCNVENAVQEAMDTFDLSREYVYRLWGRHKRIYEAIERQVPRDDGESSVN